LQPTCKKKPKVLKTMESLDTVKTFKIRKFDMEEEVQGGGEVPGSREGQFVEMLERFYTVEMLGELLSISNDSGCDDWPMEARLGDLLER
jgi:hypothetical protein